MRGKLVGGVMELSKENGKGEMSDMSPFEVVC